MTQRLKIIIPNPKEITEQEAIKYKEDLHQVILFFKEVAWKRYFDSVKRGHSYDPEAAWENIRADWRD